jgi:multidrug efflux system membrane fusion protein
MISMRTLAILLVVAGCKGAPATTQHATVPVRAEDVTRTDTPLLLTANGVVEPRQTVTVEAQVGGILTEVAFHEGDDVTAGQVLFRIDPRPLEASLRQAEATLARDIAQLASAARDAERYSALVAKDYVTKSQADQADANAAAMRATVRADSASLEAAALNLAYSTIRAPISGRTGSLLVRQGNLVRPGSGALVVINQLRPILVRFPVPQRDFLSLAGRSSGRKTRVMATTADSEQVAEAGVLTFVDNAVDSLTGTVTAKAEFGNTSGTLWPGAYVRVDVQLDVLRGAITIPSQAVVTGQDGSFVYVINEEDQAQVRPVRIGRVLGPQTVVDSGLVAGELIVTDGQSRLVPGARVEVQRVKRATK